MTSTNKTVWVRTYGSDPKFKGQSLLTRLGYIGIGWPEGGDFTGMDTQEKLRRVLEEQGKPEREKLHNRDARIIHSFINVAQIGDVAVTRNHEDGRIYVGTIVGSYIYDTTQDRHFHSIRKVEWS